MHKYHCLTWTHITFVKKVNYGKNYQQQGDLLTPHLLTYMDGNIKVIGSGYLCKRDTAQCDPSKLKGGKNYKSLDNYDKNCNHT